MRMRSFWAWMDSVIMLFSSSCVIVWYIWFFSDFVSQLPGKLDGLSQISLFWVPVFSLRVSTTKTYSRKLWSNSLPQQEPGCHAGWSCSFCEMRQLPHEHTGHSCLSSKWCRGCQHDPWWITACSATEVSGLQPIKEPAFLISLFSLSVLPAQMPPSPQQTTARYTPQDLRHSHSPPP